MKLPPPEALSHVLYEIQMMLASYLAFPMDHNPSAALYNLHLEGFLIHARCLDEFFCGGKQSDDIKPVYFNFTASTHHYPQRVSWNRMNKEIAHLTHERKSAAPDKNWLLHDELAKLRYVCLAFLQHVQSDDSLMAFQDNKAVCAELITKLTPPDPTVSIFDHLAAPRWPVASSTTWSSTVTTHIPLRDKED